MTAANKHSVPMPRRSRNERKPQTLEYQSQTTPVLVTGLITLAIFSSNVLGEDEGFYNDEQTILIIEDEDGPTDGGPKSDTLSGDAPTTEQILAEDDVPGQIDRQAQTVNEIADDNTLIISDEPEDTLILDQDTDESGVSEQGNAGLPYAAANSGDNRSPANNTFSFKVNELWGDYGYLLRSSAAADHLSYLHGQITAGWNPVGPWEFQISLRADSYLQGGDENSSRTDLDYDETFIRYNGEHYRITVGGQKVIWGRIDEFPPTDRLSTQDLSRYLIDDLADRRRASPAIRYEHFKGDAKLDVVYYPDFRGAELPERDSIWFPVNQTRGELLGLEVPPTIRALLINTDIDLDEPDSDGGFGIRYNETKSGFDYAVSLQNGRQNLPYFSFNPQIGIIQLEYPRTWIAGGDLGFESLGGTLRFEAAWLSDTPVTTANGGFSTTESIHWGAALEFYPGDGDGRLNLQLTGYKLLNTPAVFDRTNVYALNGTYELPLANETWRIKTRFYIGLDAKDTYFNPEVAFTGWKSQELYVEVHFFDGDPGTPGGYQQDNDLVSLGWRIKF